MGLNVSKGNMYDFVTHTWNTVKGACPHDCSYCYMKRFKNQRPARFDEKELKTDLGKNNYIFVGSSCDMFASIIPPEWIDVTLEKTIEAKGNQYFFQSKNPLGMFFHRNRLPLASMLGTTIETNRWYPEIMRYCLRPEDRAVGMEMLKGRMRYVTIEPIIDFDLETMIELIKRCGPVQVNIGADSGNNHLPEPSAEKVLALIDALGKFTTIARKTNLARLLG